MSTLGGVESTKLSQTKLAELADQFVGFLNHGHGFRNSQKAGMLLVFMQGEGIERDQQMALVGEVMRRFEELAQEQKRNLAAGLSEARSYLDEREPGLRTLGAVSLWEFTVAELPIELQHQARAGHEI